MGKEVAFPDYVTPGEGMADGENETKSDIRTETDDTEAYENVLLQLGQVKIIPTVRKCNFAEFKNQFNALEDGICAVDVLESGNYLDEEIEDEVKKRQSRPQKKGKARTKYASLTTKLVGAEKAKNRPDTKLVLRIRIQSPALLAILAKVMQEQWDNRPRTFYRGFSSLIYFHPQVKEVLEELESKYGGRDVIRNLGSPEGESEPGDEPKGTSLTDSPEALADLRCYVDYLSNEILPLYHQFEDLDSTCNAEVRFKDLWYLFRPGELVYRPIGAGENKVNFNIGLGHRVWRVIGVRPPLADYRITTANRRNFFGDEEEDEHKTSFGVQCYYIDYTGDEFCVVTDNFEIQPYHGQRPIELLRIFPFRFLSDYAEVMGLMKRWGENYIRILKSRHASYNWWTITTTPKGHPTTDTDGNLLKAPEYIDSEVIVDFNEAFQACPAWKPVPSILKQEDPDQTTAIDDFYTCWWSDKDRTKLLAETAEVVVLRSAATSYERNINLQRDSFLVHVRENDKNGRLTTAEHITENDYPLLPARLFGYVLRDRKFVQLDNTRLGVVEKSEDAFESLKIRPEYKDMIQSLVDDHFDKKALNKKDGVERVTLDWIKGKGKGLFILFHGAPGVGKTATAEAVAQANGKPLFAITCGDLGLTPSEVEVSLQRIFRLANTWDCVLLLDEVDTFFSQRSRGDSTLTKNALVSVFLRVLEYYDGLLFLTTNRPGTLDEAFKSRIHLTLYYPPLDFIQTMDIWQLNISRMRLVEEERCREVEEKYRSAEPSVKSPHDIPLSLQRMQINEQEILRFAEDKFNQSDGRSGWNGRQIRNAFQIASSLAHFEARRDNIQPRLTVRHFKTIHSVTEDFDRFMQEAVGKTDAEHAFERGDRADHWRPDADQERSQSLMPPSSREQVPISPGTNRYGGEVGLGLGRQRSSLSGKPPHSPLHASQAESSSLFAQRGASPHPPPRTSLTAQSPGITFNSGLPGQYIERERSPRRDATDFETIDGYPRQDSGFPFAERSGPGSWPTRKRGREGSDPEPPEWHRKRREYSDQEGYS